jgi:hypothetical protein
MASPIARTLLRASAFNKSLRIRTSISLSRIWITTECSPRRRRSRWARMRRAAGVGLEVLSVTLIFSILRISRRLRATLQQHWSSTPDASGPNIGMQPCMRPRLGSCSHRWSPWPSLKLARLASAPSRAGGPRMFVATNGPVTMMHVGSFTMAELNLNSYCASRRRRTMQ